MRDVHKDMTPLEIRIMHQIGLGKDWHYYAGDKDCRRIRKLAAEKLEDAISDACRDKEKIAPPHSEYMRVVEHVAKKDMSETSLSKTWTACLYAIRDHVEASGYENEKSRDFLKERAAEAAKHYDFTEHTRREANPKGLAR